MRLAVVSLALIQLIAAQTEQSIRPKNDFGCTPKDQGSLGTCHAFSLSCPIEHYEAMKALGKKQIKLSMNWMVFVSMVDRLCLQANNVTVNPITGWFPDSNFNRLSQMGYCEEGEYLPYRPTQDPWLSYKQNFSLAGQAFSAESSIDAIWNGFELSNNVLGYVEPRLEVTFKQQFGITSDDAKAIYCNPGHEKERLELIKDRVDPKFLQCAEKSLKKAEVFKTDCQITDLTLSSDPNARFNQFREQLTNGNHVLVNARADKLWEGAPAVNHVVDVVNFGPDTVEIFNSWQNRNRIWTSKDSLAHVFRASAIQCIPFSYKIDERYLPKTETIKIINDPGFAPPYKPSRDTGNHDSGFAPPNDNPVDDIDPGFAPPKPRLRDR